MTEYRRLAKDAKEQAARCERLARRWSAINGSLILMAAGLAAVAAIGAGMSVPSWITVTAAAVSSATGVATAGLKPADTRTRFCRLHGDWIRLAWRWGQVDRLAAHGASVDGAAWLDALHGIHATLEEDEPVAAEETWTSARVPAAKPARHLAGAHQTT